MENFSPSFCRRGNERGGFSEAAIDSRGKRTFFLSSWSFSQIEGDRFFDPLPRICEEKVSRDLLPTLRGGGLTESLSSSVFFQWFPLTSLEFLEASRRINRYRASSSPSPHILVLRNNKLCSKEKLVNKISIMKFPFFPTR